MRRPRYTHAPPLGYSAPLQSPPHLLVNGVLRYEGAFKGGIVFSASGNISQIALLHSGLAQSESASQGFDRNFIQALALFACRNTERSIEIVRHIANGILHADIVGIAGTSCKRTIPGHDNSSGYSLIPVPCYFPITSIATGIVLGGRQTSLSQA
jgi:hypothetical protein